MKRDKIPENYQTVMPYLIIEGAAGFIRFMQDVFGAKETYKAMRDENMIVHAEVMCGGSTIMFADATGVYNARPAGMFIYVDDADLVYGKALAAGGQAVSPLIDQEYGRSGGILDPFGNTWWITSL